MKGRVIAGKVLIGQITEPQESKSGIKIVQNTLQSEGIVMIAGKSTPEVKIEVKPGDRVIFPKHTGMEVIVDFEKYMLIFHRDILLIK